MESNEFDKKIREEFGKRRIKPSADSWDKLEAKLNTEENKSTSKPWKYIAAAVAVLLIAGAFLWNHDYSGSPQVVEEPVNEIIRKPEIKQEIPAKTQIASEENNSEEEISAENNVINEIAGNRETSVKKEKTSEIPVSEENKYEEAIVLETISLEPPILEEKVIQSKLEEVIAVAGNEEVSDDEVEALLTQAAAEISRERKLKLYTSNAQVNADALLAEVEDEIYQSFKAKVFEVLKEGYLKAKTAVANRNN
jgi:hypothetical protein